MRKGQPYNCLYVTSLKSWNKNRSTVQTGIFKNNFVLIDQYIWFATALLILIYQK